MGTGPRYARAVSPTQRVPITVASTITLPDGSTHTLITPAGLHVSLYAVNVPTARFMALGPRGDVFVGSWGAGTLSVLVHRAGGSGLARTVTLLGGLTVPHGLAYHGGLLYLGEEGQVSTLRYAPATMSVSDWRVIITLPSGGRHVTRTVGFGPDGSLYVSVGSSCNECVEVPGRAMVMRYRADGSGGIGYAHGLRNAVGLAWQPGSGLLWAADNGRDMLGENIPPDEVDLIRQGGNYGWPSCWGNQQIDPAVPAASGYCARTIAPALGLPAHSAPLGAAFVTGTLLPPAYRGGLVVAYHGSQYRTVPTGYKVVSIPVHGTAVGVPHDLVAGWLSADGSAWGRPVGVLIAADGSLLISDDQAGVVYRVAPTGH